MIINGIILLFILPFIAGLSAIKFKEPFKNQIQLLVAFSGAFLFAITVTHLIPGLFGEGHDHHSHHHYEAVEISYYILLGFLIQLILDIFSKGVEHGHLHPTETKKDSYIFSIMIGLCIHAFIEGVPLGIEQNESNVNLHTLLWGIILHKMPAAFVLGVLLLSMSVKKTNMILMIAIFSLMSPLSMLLGQFLESYKQLYDIVPIFLAIVAGSFLHISTTIILESGNTLHRLSILKLILILAGFGLAGAIHFL